MSVFAAVRNREVILIVRQSEAGRLNRYRYNGLEPTQLRLPVRERGFASWLAFSCRRLHGGVAKLASALIPLDRAFRCNRNMLFVVIPLDAGEFGRAHTLLPLLHCIASLWSICAIER